MTHLGRRCTTAAAALALGLALTLGAVAPAMAADDARGRCIAEAAQAGLLGPNRNPGNTTFIVGTEDNDLFPDRATAGPGTVICGFGGNDLVFSLQPGVTFLGGDGDDNVSRQFGGVFNGGAGNDRVLNLIGGTFDGGAGDDRVVHLIGGTFNGGAGDDRVAVRSGGTFNQD